MLTNPDVPYERQMLHILRNYQRLQEANLSLADENRALISQNATLKSALTAKRKEEQALNPSERTDLLAKIAGLKTCIANLNRCIEDYKLKIADYKYKIANADPIHMDQIQALIDKNSKLKKQNYELREELSLFRFKHNILRSINDND